MQELLSSFETSGGQPRQHRTRKKVPCGASIEFDGDDGDGGGNDDSDEQCFLLLLIVHLHHQTVAMVSESDILLSAGVVAP
jgi:hypothetical protein